LGTRLNEAERLAQGMDLPLQLARGPAGVDRLRLIEGAGLGLVYAQE
jgi:hypothetical protein